MNERLPVALEAVVWMCSLLRCCVMVMLSSVLGVVSLGVRSAGCAGGGVSECGGVGGRGERAQVVSVNCDCDEGW